MLFIITNCKLCDSILIVKSNKLYIVFFIECVVNRLQNLASKEKDESRNFLLKQKNIVGVDQMP